MTVVESTTSGTIYERRKAITENADERQGRIVGDVLRDGFAIDWQKVLNVGDSSDPLFSAERLLRDQLKRDEFRESIVALGINGRLLSTFVQREHERLAGIRAVANVLPLDFAESSPFALPEGSIEYWRRVLQLSDRQTEEVRRWLLGFDTQQRAINSRITETLLRRLAQIYSEAISGSDGVAGFVRRAREVMPNESAALLETEYRTHLSTVYNADRREQTVSRAAVFPFMQVMVIRDSRITWWICLPMGTAGPNETGYIAATTDAIWIKWRFPAHYQCRTTTSPIGYREAQRLGILAADGVTKIALRGSNPDRPYDDPPEFAENPNPPHDVRRVEPQEGFGG